MIYIFFIKRRNQLIVFSSTIKSQRNETISHYTTQHILGWMEAPWKQTPDNFGRPRQRMSPEWFLRNTPVLGRSSRKPQCIVSCTLGLVELSVTKGFIMLMWFEITYVIIFIWNKATNICQKSVLLIPKFREYSYYQPTKNTKINHNIYVPTHWITIIPQNLKE